MDIDIEADMGASLADIVVSKIAMGLENSVDTPVEVLERLVLLVKQPNMLLVEVSLKHFE